MIQNLAAVDVPILRDIDVLDDAGDVGGHPNFVGFDIGVVGRHDLAAGDVPVLTGDSMRAAVP
jgi:hypothetical protein